MDDMEATGVIGQHFIVDAYDCNASVIDCADEVKSLILESLRELRLEILMAYFHTFSPQGVTGTIVISSSHFSIHTWPEYRYTALDLYTCSHQDVWNVLQRFLRKIGARRVFMHEIPRGHKSRIFSGNESIREPGKPLHVTNKERGNESDMKVLKELINGKHNILYRGFSGFQDILLVEGKDLRLYLNDELQFSSLDERYYHEALVFPAMELAKARKRILILGGGDGLALREILKYTDVAHVDLVDIDPVMIRLAKDEPALAAINAGSLRDGRVKVHIMDAMEYLKKTMEGYDVIIVDFPDPADPTTSLLYTKELFIGAGRHLNAGGVVSCQSNSPRDTPRVYWSIAKTLNTAGFKTKAYYTVVPSFGVWGFHLASRENIMKIIPDISVPHRAIDSNLERLFHLPPSLQPPKTGLISNCIKDLKLHVIYQKEINQF
ncbi:adenosylmethionine decarboxylase [Siminovitchia sp. FSL W7-1587]|uniref:adenosylmethionine decarboxylase n=1 Tax=Siminovitchia sp. FSL W7-1587 TaxID=2954699 RepID=UPI0030D3153D